MAAAERPSRDESRPKRGGAAPISVGIIITERARLVGPKGRRIRRPLGPPGAPVSEGGQVPVPKGATDGAQGLPSPEGAVPPWRGGLETPVTRHARRTATAKVRAPGAGAGAEAAPSLPVPPETAQEPNRQITRRRRQEIIPAPPGARDAREKVRKAAAKAPEPAPDTYPGTGPRNGRAPRPLLARARNTEPHEPRETVRVRLGAPCDMGRAMATEPPHLRLVPATPVAARVAVP